MNLVYREAKIEECDVLADYINLTAGGILDFLYDGLVRGTSTVELVAGFLAESDRYDSFSSITVAETDGEIIGIVSAYPAKFHRIDEEMAQFFPAERIEVVRGFFSTRVEDSYYLSAIFVHESVRGKGIGSALIELTKEKARNCGYNKLSLLVLADNEVALKVYEKNGFYKVKHVNLTEQPLIPHKGGVYLLVCDL